jgi:hypothetical protein
MAKDRGLTPASRSTPSLPPASIYRMTPKSDDRPKSELHWFPFYVDDFTGSPSVQRMTDAEVGRFVRLLLLAWGNGTREPMLEPGDLEHATPRVKAQFRERAGGFTNAKLSKVWRVQKARHDSAVQRGKKGGRPKAKGKLAESSAYSQLEAEGKAGAKEGALVLRESIDSLPSSSVSDSDAGALAVDTPRPAIENVRRGGSEKLGSILGRLIPRTA